jgi:uncharacterized membrane protein YraQ (UPF0718 family)
MDTATIVMMALAVVVLLFAYWKAPATASKGLDNTASLLVEMGPRLLAAFLLIGVLQAFVPPEALARWMGRDAGGRGIVIGTVLGTLMPGGPITLFPVVAALSKAGVAVGPLAAFLTAWSLFGLQRILVWELPILGARFVAVRILVSLFFPFCAGWAFEAVWARIRM